MRRRWLPLLVLLLVACDPPGYEAPPPQMPERGAGEQEAKARVAPRTVEAEDQDEEAEHAHDGDPIALSPREQGVLVLQTAELTRPAEVVGVVDAHEKMGHHDEALAHLKARAAALGANAVVGVEFHHGEGEGEPTHLSGLAVRFLQTPP